MKTQPVRSLTGALLAVAFLGVGAAAAAQKSPEVVQDSRINVQFVEPDKYTDIADSYSDTSDSQREWVLAEVRKYLRQRGESTLREDLQLTIRVTDIDLAGEFEPWRFHTNPDIRVVKEIYPTRIKLQFQLTDSAGTVLAEGERSLTDFGHIPTFTVSNEPLRYEKQVLRDWLAREFREHRKT